MFVKSELGPEDGYNLPTPEQVLVLGGLAMHEDQTEQTEFATTFPEREAQFAELAPGSTRVVICSDERKLNPASARALQEMYGVDPNIQTNRTFGGTHGYAYVGGLAAAAQGGEQAVQPFAGNFNGLTAETRTLLDQSSEAKLLPLTTVMTLTTTNPA